MHLHTTSSTLVDFQDHYLIGWDMTDLKEVYICECLGRERESFFMNHFYEGAVWVHDAFPASTTMKDDRI